MGETQYTHVKCTVNQTKSSLWKQTSFHDASTGFPANHIWGMAKEIPYCWHVTPQIWIMLLIGCYTRFASSKSTQIWVVLLIGCTLKFVSNKSEALPRSAVIPQMSFHGETNGGAKKWLLFSQARKSREDDLQCRSDNLGWLNMWFSQDVYFQPFSKQYRILSMMGALFLDHNWGRWGH